RAALAKLKWAGPGTTTSCLPVRWRARRHARMLASVPPETKRLPAPGGACRSCCRSSNTSRSIWAAPGKWPGSPRLVSANTLAACMPSTLALLVRSGVLERTGVQVRVAPRFLSHAECTAERLRCIGRWLGPADALEAALGTWDDWMHDVRQGSLALWEFMAER